MKNLLKIAVTGAFLFGLVDLPRFVGPVPVPWVFMPVAFAETESSHAIATSQQPVAEAAMSSQDYTEGLKTAQDNIDRLNSYASFTPQIPYQRDLPVPPIPPARPPVPIVEDQPPKPTAEYPPAPTDDAPPFISRGPFIGDVVIDPEISNIA